MSDETVRAALRALRQVEWSAVSDAELSALHGAIRDEYLRRIGVPGEMRGGLGILAEIQRAQEDNPQEGFSFIIEPSPRPE